MNEPPPLPTSCKKHLPSQATLSLLKSYRCEKLEAWSLLRAAAPHHCSSSNTPVVDVGLTAKFVLRYPASFSFTSPTGNLGHSGGTGGENRSREGREEKEKREWRATERLLRGLPWVKSQHCSPELPVLSFHPPIAVKYTSHMTHTELTVKGQRTGVRHGGALVSATGRTIESDLDFVFSKLYQVMLWLKKVSL